jgi:tetratricopeptide (TPR) repeat protein
LGPTLSKTRMARLALTCAVLLSLAGCAARGPSPQVVAELGKANALLREGCYTCLKEAQTIFERLSAPPRPTPGAERGAFEATLLIAMREKELGLPAETSLDRARQHATRLASPKATVALKTGTVTPVPPAVLLDAAALVIGETAGLDPEQRTQYIGFRGRPPLEVTNPQRRALDAWVDTDPVSQYVALMIDCEQLNMREAVKPADILAKYTGVPLIQFRLSVCGGLGAPQAATIREANPRFLDTLPWEGRRVLVGSQTEGVDLYKGTALLGEAHEAFPASHWLAIYYARSSQSLAEFDASLAAFDSVLADVPTHRDAMLGRVTSLSYLMRHQEAIVTTTRMIELGTWHIGDAYYWRAWNQYNLKALEPAWSDVEVATKMLSTTNVYMLAGLIAYDRKELPTAVLRFDRAFELDVTNCDAVWMGGLVRVDQQDWPGASPKFARAMSCFSNAAAQAKSDLAALDAEVKRAGGQLLPPGREQRQRTKLTRDMELAAERSAQAAFNAAGGYARMGQRALALAHIEMAIVHPRMKEKGEALKVAIEKMPQ